MKFKGKWKVDQARFEKACNEILDEGLNKFKIKPGYFDFVGNDIRPEKTAQAFYDYIKEHYYPLLKHFDTFLFNDKVGSPITHEIEGRQMSAGTLRFIKVLGDIIYHLGGQLMASSDSAMDIIEIGSGYGGQCKIISDHINYNSYTLIDIKPSLNVAKIYLPNFFNVDGDKLRFVDTENINLENEYDLVISDYCLSELDDEGIRFYEENVLSKCKMGYFTINHFADQKTLFLSLHNCFKTIEKIKEEPATSRHNNWIYICHK